jgi:toxin-antitoxin system PIN domain toxin
MPGVLLDVNLLLALAWPTHTHHADAHRWFSLQRFSARPSEGWATCAFTQAGFLRLSSQAAVVKVAVTFADAYGALQTSLAAPEHEFWPAPYSVCEIMPEIRLRIMGHQQITDAVLLDTAIRNSGRLASFDQRLRTLLPPESQHQSAIEIIRP